MTGSGIAFRPVEARDRDLLLRIYASTRAAELALLPWSPEQKAAFLEQQFTAQDHHYRARHPGAQFSVITCRHQDVGRVYLAREAGLHMLDFTVLPEFRGQGIGSAVVCLLQDEARQRRSPLTVYVEVFNPSLAWFEKRGFEVQQQNEAGIHALMRWMPAEAEAVPL